MGFEGLDAWLAVMATLWGAIWGSFANVAIHRMPRGLSVLRPGSACPRCGTPIHWYHNVPVLSYLFLGGRCAACREAISIQYPLVELIVAVLALAIWQRAALDPVAMTMGDRAVLFLFRFTFALGLVIVIFSDLETLLIPDLISLPGIAMGLAASLVIHPHTGVGWMSSLIGAAAGAAVVMLVRTVYWLVFHMEGMGFGDVKLMGMIGAFLGYESLVFVFFAGSLQGLLYAAASWLAGARQPPVPTDGGAPPGAGEAPATFRRMVVPFGPFLGLAALEWLFFSQVFIDLLNDLFML